MPGSAIKKSVIVANADATPLVPTYGYLAGAPMNVSCATVAAAPTDAPFVAYEFGFISSSARVVGIEMLNDGTTIGTFILGVLCNNKVGGTFTQTSGATFTPAAGAVPVTNADRVFNGSISTVFATTEFTDVFAPVILPAQVATASNATLRVWELLGLQTDPSYEFIVAMTCTTGPPFVGGNITLQWRWVR